MSEKVLTYTSLTSFNQLFKDALETKQDKMSVESQKFLNQCCYLGDISKPKFDIYTNLKWDTSNGWVVDNNWKQYKMYYNRTSSKYNYIDNECVGKPILFNFECRSGMKFKPLICQDWDWMDGVDDHGAKCPAWYSAKIGNYDYGPDWITEPDLLGYQGKIHGEGNDIKCEDSGWINVLFYTGDFGADEGGKNIAVPVIRIIYTQTQNELESKGLLDSYMEPTKHLNYKDPNDIFD